MKQGALIFDEQTDRYDIRFDLADYYGGLHCGETFDVMGSAVFPQGKINVVFLGARLKQADVGVGDLNVGQGGTVLFELP